MPAEGTPDYRIGPGDGIRVTVVGQPDVTGQHVVGPDGSVSVPLAGTVALRGDTRDRAAERIGDRLQTFFLEPLRVTVEVTDYRNNKAYVLGRVERPGVVDLTGAGTLLQVLAEAGGLPVREYRSFLARCAIIRGRNQILWIDLIDLLQGGNVSLNVPLRNGDVVFIPDSEDATVFVMGEVAAPGAVPIKVRLDLVQALAQAGGPTEDAELESVFLIRPNGADGFGAPIRIDFKALIETGDFRENVELKAGDILFVARNGMGDVNYVLRKLQPSFAALTLGVAVR
ncbi:MAG: polysaccharide biosynthesis/export family protein [Planctomycetota bacterium]